MMVLIEISNNGPKNTPVHIKNAEDFYKHFGKPHDIMDSRKKKLSKILKRMTDDR